MPQRFAEVRAQHGGIHLLINNGAISKLHTRLDEPGTEQFDHVMAANVRGAMLCDRALVQANRGLPYVRLLNIAPTPWTQNKPRSHASLTSNGA
ncbi:SDR family oxidoreductase [Plesiomonas shigelloides]|uniref:SDR family oxidoreductase n=1 Tax=Plesiomonas shigelloides TaxID=703 RepID=A0A8I1WA02_PLESH|nr:SDR family oxidoreductase [Plesiomonas shigelloides]